MTRAEALAALSGSEATEASTPASSGAVAAAFTSIAGRRYIASLAFNGTGALSVIQLRLADAAAELPSAFDELAAWVSGQSGQPAGQREGASPAGSWRRSASWATPTSRIELRAWETALEDSRVLHLDLSTRELDALDARGVELTYAPSEPLARRVR